MNPTASILLIEDDSALAGSLQNVLEEEGYRVKVEKRGDDGLAHAGREPLDLVLTDLRLPGLNGLDLVRQLHASRPRLPIILMTAHGTTETAIEATKSGAYDYLLKPFEMDELVELVANTLNSSRLMSEPVALGNEPGAPGRDAIIGQSRVMQEIYKQVGRVASKPLPVLIRGETGTGKELIARAIYQYSDRSNAPFVAVNCAAIPETLLESELFGHERGAFTGAEARRIGRFEQAHQGTLFLDEIGDLSPGSQVKLLRVLQEKSIQRLGGRENIQVDVRVIAATHRDLETALQAKQFREDLFYRLNVAVIALPPLRERRDDVSTLVDYFLHKHGPDLGTATPCIQPDAIQFLQAQPWPGNIRELENVVRKALLLARGYSITAEQVRQVLSTRTSGPGDAAGSLHEYVAGLLAAAQRGDLPNAHAELLREAEREMFTQAIHLAQGNQAKASRWLGVSRLTMREKLHQFGAHPRTGGDGEAEAVSDPTR